MKKKILLLTTLSSMVAVVGTVVFANGGLSGLSALATNGEVWHHYAAVAPTDTTHGSKEFWASSTDGCATHTFTDPGVTCVEHDFSKYKSFATLTWDDDRYVWSLNEQRDLGIIPVVTGKTVTYGLYPQTNVDDSTLISALNALTTPGANGYYLYENAYYAKVSASPYEDYYEFDNGTTIVSGTTYWFKCEPITWNVLSNNNDEYYILSSVLLDAYRYDIDSNNYANSKIRSFLNNDFFNLAFALGDSYIQTTTVDNSASTTDSNENPYACNNTQDKVFLPSYKDYTNSGYGFSTSENSTNTRYCKTTDWARARGANYETDSGSDQYNGYYWTRSPDSEEDPDYVWIVFPDGYLTYNYVNNTDVSVRPALSITIA